MIKNLEWQTVKSENARVLADKNILLVQSGWAWEKGDTLIIDGTEVVVSSVTYPINGEYPERFSWLLKIEGENVPQLKEKLKVIENG